MHVSLISLRSLAKPQVGQMGLELISIFNSVCLTNSKQVTRGKTESCNNTGHALVLHKETGFVASPFHTPFVPMETLLSWTCNSTMLLNLSLTASSETVLLLPVTGVK